MSTKDLKKKKAAKSPNSSWLDKEELIWNNLLFLGLNSKVLNDKFSVNLHKSMFRNPNPKALQIVLHFLFHSLNREEARKMFRDVWPVHDRTQARDFITICHAKLETMEKAGIFPPTTIRKSHLTSAAGDRLLIIIWKFSDYVLSQVGLREYPSYKQPSFNVPPHSSTALLEHLIDATKVQISLATKEFLAHTTMATSVQKQWEVAAEKMVGEYHRLDRAERNVNNQISDFNKKGGPQDTTCQEDTDSVLNTVFTMHKQAKEGKPTLTALIDKENAPHLNGRELRRKMFADSKDMPTETRDKVSNQRDLDLNELLERWNTSMGKLHSILSNQNLTGTESPASSLVERICELEPELQNSVEEHSNNVQAVKDLNFHLSSAVLPCIQEQVQSLEASAKLHLNRHSSSNSSNLVRTPQDTPTQGTRHLHQQPAADKLVLELLPPTPTEDATKITKMFMPETPVDMQSSLPSRNIPSNQAAVQRAVTQVDEAILSQVNIKLAQESLQRKILAPAVTESPHQNATSDRNFNSSSPGVESPSSFLFDKHYESVGSPLFT